MTKHFKEEEFYCPCARCKADPSRRVPVNPKLLDWLEDVRLHFGLPVIINSGVRCAEHNREVGGVEHSQHVKGNAADIRIRGVCPRVIYSYLNYTHPNECGLGLYTNFVHFDVRLNKTRWTK